MSDERRILVRHICGGLVVRSDDGTGLDCLECGVMFTEADIPKASQVRPSWDWVADIQKPEYTERHRKWPVVSEPEPCTTPEANHD